MAPQDRQHEIETAEQWLAEVSGDLPAPDTDLIKLQVRIAAGEQWLAQRLSDQSPPDLAERMKHFVRARLASARDGHRPRHVRRAAKRGEWPIYRRLAAAGLAAAACLLAAVGLSLLRKSGWDVRSDEGRMQPPTHARLDELPLVAAFESFEEDELTQSLGVLADDLCDLESSWGKWSARRSDETAYEDLFDAIDDLLREVLLDDDWS